MKDENKTNLQLIQELNELRRKISKFNAEFSLANRTDDPARNPEPKTGTFFFALKNSFLKKIQRTGNHATTPVQNTPTAFAATETPKYHAPNPATKHPEPLNFRQHAKNYSSIQPPPNFAPIKTDSRPAAPFPDWFDGLPQPVVTVDAELTILRHNTAFSELLAKPAAAPDGLNLLTAFPDFHESPFYPAALDVFSTGLPHEVHGWYRSRWLKARIVRTNGGLFFIFEDLTQQKQSEMELLKNEARFRLITENIQDGILLLENNVLTYANQRAAEILGYPRNFLNRWNPTLETAPAWVEFQTFLRSSGKVAQEFWFSRKDGTRRFLQIRTTTCREKSGNVRQYVVLSDFTQPKQFGEVLRRRDQILTAISEASLVLMQSADYETAIQKSLEILGTATNVTRVFLARNPEILTANTDLPNFDWPAEPVPTSGANPGDLSRSWKYWKKDLSAGKPIISPLVPTSSASLKIKQVSTILAIPVFTEKKLWGCLCFVEASGQRAWNPVEIEALKSAGSVIGSTLLRWHTETLRQMQKMLGLKLGTISHLHEAFEHLLTALVQIEGIDSSAIFQAEPQTRSFRLLARKNLPTDFALESLNFTETSPRFRRIFSGKPLFLNTSQVTAFPLITPEKNSFKAMALIPLRIQRRVNAVLFLASRTVDEIPAETARILENLGAQLGGIIARIQTQEALSDSQKNLQTLFNSIDDFLLIFNSAGQILHFNPAIQTRLKYPPAALRQLTIHQIFAGTPALKIDQLLRELKRPAAVLCQFPIFTQSGTEIPAETKISPGIWNSETVYFGISRDISERKRIELELEKYRFHLEQLVEKRTEELEKANAELKSFAYTVSHDLKTPLRAIHGFAQILQENYANKSETDCKQYLQRITEATQRMDALIFDLLAYSRLTQTKIQCAAIDLNRVILELLEQHQNEIRDKHAKISITGILPTVLGHPLILEQIFSNLIQNGLKFVPPDRFPEINIRAGKTADSVRIWVEDNGIGIEEKYWTRIFHPFERLHPSKTFPGTGIGLAIVRKGVERLGGDVGVVSTPGVGSNFWVELKTNQTVS